MPLNAIFEKRAQRKITYWGQPQKGLFNITQTGNFFILNQLRDAFHKGMERLQALFLENGNHNQSFDLLASKGRQRGFSR